MHSVMFERNQCGLGSGRWRSDGICRHGSEFISENAAARLQPSVSNPGCELAIERPEAVALLPPPVGRNSRICGFEPGTIGVGPAGVSWRLEGNRRRLSDCFGTSLRAPLSANKDEEYVLRAICPLIWPLGRFSTSSSVSPVGQIMRLPTTTPKVHGDKCGIVQEGGGGGACQVKFAVVNFAAGNFAEAPGCCVVNFAETPRNVVVCRALQTRRSSATCANFAEDPRFGVGNLAANLKRGISPTKLTAPGPPPPQGRIRREGTPDAAPGALRLAVGGGCQRGWGGYCRLPVPLKLALSVRGTVAGHRLGALGGGGRLPLFQCIPAPPPNSQPKSAWDEGGIEVGECGALSTDENTP